LALARIAAQAKLQMRESTARWLNRADYQARSSGQHLNWNLMHAWPRRDPDHLAPCVLAFWAIGPEMARQYTAGLIILTAATITGNG
jgi:hypothetical protein